MEWSSLGAGAGLSNFSLVQTEVTTQEPPIEHCRQQFLDHGRKKGGRVGSSPPSRFWNITFSNEIFSNKLIFLLSRGFNNILPVLAPPWKKSFRRTCSQHNKTQLKIYFTCVELKHIVQSAFWAQTTEDVDELLESASGVSSSSGWNVALRLDLGTAETYSF